MVAALIVGCGGDDDDSPPVNTAGKPSTGGAAGSTGASGGKSGSGGTSAMAGGGGQASEQIEVAGTWVSNQFGSTETDVIDDTTWSTAFGDSAATVSEIVEFSNSERYAIRKAPNDPTAFNPGTFDRVVWTKPVGDTFYYCTVIYGCSSADLTETGDGAGGAGSAGSGAGGASDEGLCQLSVVDDSDPEHGGCGGFQWTKLTRQ
jgi:hypothetical protein